MVYRVGSNQIPETLDELWKREMPSAAYIPRHLPCQTPHGPTPALVFVVDRQKDGYVRNLTHEQLMNIIHNAHGTYGPCIEYVLETAQALTDHGIHDARLNALVRQLRSGISDPAQS